MAKDEAGRVSAVAWRWERPEGGLGTGHCAPSQSCHEMVTEGLAGPSTARPRAGTLAPGAGEAQDSCRQERVLIRTPSGLIGVGGGAGLRRDSACLQRSGDNF